MAESHKGIKPSKETRKLLSSLKQGDKHWNFGKHLSKSTKNKIGFSKQGEKHHQYGKSGDMHPTAKAIIQMNLNGEFVKRWGSSGEIYKETGYNHRNIRDCCSGTKRKTAHGFKWKFETV